MLTITVVHDCFLLYCMNRFGSVATMHGGSMEPTLHAGGNEPFGYLKADLLYLDKMSLRNYTFSRGDVVVFRYSPFVWCEMRVMLCAHCCCNCGNRLKLCYSPWFQVTFGAKDVVGEEIDCTPK